MVFAFDCLYLNGASLLHAPLSERRAALYGALKPVEGQLAFATAKTSRDVEELAVRLGFVCEAGEVLARLGYEGAPQWVRHTLTDAEAALGGPCTHPPATHHPRGPRTF